MSKQIKQRLQELKRAAMQVDPYEAEAVRDILLATIDVIQDIQRESKPCAAC